MSTLLVDLGNTCLKWRFWSGGGGSPGGGGGRVHRGRELVAVLEEAWALLARPDAVVGACVAGGRLADDLSGWVARRWGRRVRWLDTVRRGPGLRNAYLRFERLGVDRWLAMLGARTMVSGAYCVADCGTAMTLDVVDPAGQHLGGLILPGSGLMRAALARDTGDLPAVDRGQPDLLAVDTESAIYSGSVLGSACALEGLWHRVQDRLKLPMTLMLTGGDAPLLREHLLVPARHEPDLVFAGMRVSLESEAAAP